MCKWIGQFSKEVQTVSKYTGDTGVAFAHQGNANQNSQESPCSAQSLSLSSSKQTPKGSEGRGDVSKELTAGGGGVNQQGH